MFPRQSQAISFKTQSIEIIVCFVTALPALRKWSPSLKIVSIRIFFIHFTVETMWQEWVSNLRFARNAMWNAISQHLLRNVAWLSRQRLCFPLRIRCEYASERGCWHASGQRCQNVKRSRSDWRSLHFLHFCHQNSIIGG